MGRHTNRDLRNRRKKQKVATKLRHERKQKAKLQQAGGQAPRN
jgi:hypothetical protein